MADVRAVTGMASSDQYHFMHKLQRLSNCVAEDFSEINKVLKKEELNIVDVDDAEEEKADLTRASPPLPRKRPACRAMARGGVTKKAWKV